MSTWLLLYAFLLLAGAVLSFRKEPALDRFSSGTASFRGRSFNNAIVSGLAMAAFILCDGFLLWPMEAMPAFGLAGIAPLAAAAAGVLSGALLFSWMKKAREAASLPEIVAGRAGALAGRAAGALSCAFLLLFAASQFVSAGTLLSLITGIDRQWSIIAAASLFSLLAIMGGGAFLSFGGALNAVMLAAAMVAVLSWLKAGNAAPAMPSYTGAVPIAQGSAAIAYSIAVPFLAILFHPVLFAGSRSAKSPGASRISGLSAAVLVAGLACVIAILGSWVSKNLSPSGGPPLFESLLVNVFPPSTSALLLLAFIAAGVSSGSAALLAAGVTLERDVAGGNSTIRTRCWIGIAAFAGAMIGIIAGDGRLLLLAAMSSYSAGMAVPATMALFSGKGRKFHPRFASAAMGLGFAAGGIGAFLPGQAKIAASAGGFAVSAVVMLAGMRKDA